MVRVSRPLCLYCTSARICASSCLSLSTRFLAKLTSAFRRSGSYLVLPTLEFEFTEKKLILCCKLWHFLSCKSSLKKYWTTHRDLAKPQERGRTSADFWEKSARKDSRVNFVIKYMGKWMLPELQIGRMGPLLPRLPLVRALNQKLDN